MEWFNFTDVTQNFDCVFWCGDLNFRLSQPREEVVNWVEQQQFPLPSPYKMEMDQLTNSILQGKMLGKRYCKEKLV